MKKTIALLAALTTMSAIASAETYALVIGINDYPEPLDAQGKPLKDDKGNVMSDDLKGCVNDATFWKETLTKNFGVKASNIHMLTDSKATEENFIKEVTWLVQNAKPGDSIFFSYSGHGSQVELDDQPEEADGLTEVICLVDSLIPDNFFSDWAKDMKNNGVKATYVFDSCHSGGMDRDVSKKNRVQRNKFVPKTRLNAKQRANHLDPIEQATIKMAASTSRGTNTGSYAFMMASLESQTSSDLEFLDDTPPYGAFTYCMKIVLAENAGLSVEQAVAEVKKILKDNEFEQVPKAEYSDANRPTKPIIS